MNEFLAEDVFSHQKFWFSRLELFTARRFSALIDSTENARNDLINQSKSDCWGLESIAQFYLFFFYERASRVTDRHRRSSYKPSVK